MWSVRRMPAGRLAGARAMAVARPKRSASIADLNAYVNSIGLKVELPGSNPDQRGDPMTKERLPLSELLQKAGDGDFLRSVAEAVLQLLMEADVEGLIGAGRHERSPERL